MGTGPWARGYGASAGGLRDGCLRHGYPDEFIRHAAEIGKPFAMLLKAQYWHAAKRAQLFREIPPSYVLPLTWRPDFLFKERNGKKGASPLMDVMWCVWLTPQMQGVQTVFKPLMRPEKEK